METSTECKYNYTFDVDDAYYGWSHGTLRFDDIQSLKSFTFSVDMTIGEVSRRPTSAMLLKVPPNSPKSDTTNPIVTEENKENMRSLESTKDQQVRPHEDTVDSKENEINEVNEVHGFHPDIESIDSMARYEWIIDSDSKTMLKKVRESKVGTYINGPIRKLGPFTFYVEFDPAGRTLEDDASCAWFGIVAWYWPPGFSKALLYFKMRLRNTDGESWGHLCLDADHTCFGWRTDMKFENLIQMDSIELTIDVRVIEIFDDDGRSVIQSLRSEMSRFVVINEQIPEATFEWKIESPTELEIMKKAPNVHAFPGVVYSAFGLKWYMEFWPKLSAMHMVWGVIE